MAVRAQFENSNEYDHETLKKPFLSKASDYLFIFFLKSSVSGTLFLVILFFYCYYHQIAAIAYVANSFSTYVSLPSMKSRRLRDTHKFILSRGHRRIGKLLQVHTQSPFHYANRLPSLDFSPFLSLFPFRCGIVRKDTHNSAGLSGKGEKTGED